MTTLFWICAIAGAVVLVASILLDGAFEGVLESLQLDADGPFSIQVLSSFLAAFGIVGLAAEAMAAPTPVSLAVALGGGLLLGWAALRLTRSLISMRTDPTPTSNDLLGRAGRVITPIGSSGTGEVLVRLGGQQQKLGAAAEIELDLGAQVRVVEVVSSTRVRVVPDEEFWSEQPGHNGPTTPEGKV